MRTDQRILGYLGRALSLELSAVQMYSTQARMAATWGLDTPSARFRAEAQEEMQHVERIIARMLALGVAPNASQLRPASIGPDLLTLLQADYEFELELIELYSNASQHGKRIGSNDDRVFFQNLLEEEQTHARELAEWIRETEPPKEYGRF
ncbi:MAG: ferritin-like domain-containing protein [Candidatus Thiodiazotropha sp.]